MYTRTCDIGEFHPLGFHYIIGHEDHVQNVRGTDNYRLIGPTKLLQA